MNANGQPLPDDVVTVSTNVLGGEPVFTGSRVPVKTLLDYLEAGDSLDLFLYDFPTVSRSQAVAILEWAKGSIVMALA